MKVPLSPLSTQKSHLGLQLPPSHILDGSAFDSTVEIRFFGGKTLAEANPDISEFINLIDNRAYDIFTGLMRKFHLAHQKEAQRMACYTAAEGNSAAANMSYSPLLHQVHGINYFKGIVPSIIPENDPDLKKRRFKMAFLFMVHEINGYSQLCRTLEMLDDGDSIILIHVDARSHSSQLYSLLDSWIKARKNTSIYLAKTRYSNIWGHISLVFTQISGFFELLDLADWDYIINVSNYDYPLKSGGEMHEVLSLPETKNKNFIQYWTDTGDLTERLFLAHLGEADYSTVYSPPELGFIESPYTHWRSYKHHQWLIFTPEVIRFFRKDPHALHFLAFAEHTFIPDEMYFGTDMIVNDNKRYLRFAGGAHPSWLGFKDRHLFPPYEPVPSFFMIRKLNTNGHLFGEDRLIEWVEKHHFKKHSFGEMQHNFKCSIELMSVRKECLREIAGTVSHLNAMIVIPVNTPYMAVARNLACTLDRIGIKNVMYWALDLESYEELLQQEKMAILLPGLNPLPERQTSNSMALRNVLRSKPKLIKYILSSGLSAWVMDADMVAVNDFRNFNDPDTDVLISLVNTKTLPTPSSSMMYFRNSEKTMRLLDKIEQELEQSSQIGDEEALTRIMMRPSDVEVLQPSHEKLYQASPSGDEGTDKLGQKGDDNPIKIRYLDPHSFMSSVLFLKNPKLIPEGFNKWFTLHLNGEDSKSNFGKKGLWLVDDDGYCLKGDQIPPDIKFS